MHAIELAKVQQGTPEWLQIRRQGLGGSDAAAALGISAYKTPYALWLEKRGEAPELEENAMMKWGKIHEAAVRQEYAEATGRTVRLPDVVFAHPKHQFMLASIDGVTDDGRLLEIKTTRNPQGWGEEGSDEVPQHYLLQVQHYLCVMGLEVADVAVLIQGYDFRRYEIPADLELQEMLIAGEQEFWRTVQEGTPPAVTSVAEAMQRYKLARPGDVQADAEMIKTYELLGDVRAKLKEGQALEDELKAKIMAYLGEHGGDALLSGTKPLVTWKERKGSERLDSKALKAAYPDIAAEFTTTGEPTRTFLVK